MESPSECFELAEQCEQHAEAAQTDRAREMFLEGAARWRRLGNDLIAERSVMPFRPRSPLSS